MRKPLPGRGSLWVPYVTNITDQLRSESALFIQDFRIPALWLKTIPCIDLLLPYKYHTPVCWIKPCCWYTLCTVVFHLIHSLFKRAVNWLKSDIVKIYWRTPSDTSVVFDPCWLICSCELNEKEHDKFKRLKPVNFSGIIWSNPLYFLGRFENHTISAYFSILLIWPKICTVNAKFKFGKSFAMRQIPAPVLSLLFFCPDSVSWSLNNRFRSFFGLFPRSTWQVVGWWRDGHFF